MRAHAFLSAVPFVFGVCADSAAVTNLLPNGSFDINVDGWTVDVNADAGSVSWQSDDADGSGLSGSLKYATDPFGDQTAARSPCFAVPAGGGASAGGKGNILFVNGISRASFAFQYGCAIYASSNCSGASAGSLEPATSTDSGWAAMTTANGTLPANSASAQCSIFIQNVFNAQPAAVAVDDLFFEADYIFHAGFD